MPKNPHAVALGQKGGSAKTPAKAEAARANGKKGGRPKLQPKACAMKYLIILAVLCSACGSSSPTAPTPPIIVVTPPPTSYTVSGLVTATNGGQPLGGLSVDLNGQPATTTGAGAFSYTMTSGSTARLALSGSGIVPRALTLNVGAARTVTVGAIALGGGFDLWFYRQFVRNGFEGGNEPLRRWTAAPSVYLRTIQDNGTAIDPAMLDTVEAVVRDAMPRWSGFNPVTVTRGIDTRAGQVGWLTIAWPGVVGADRQCGQSNVGLSGGVMQLRVPSGGVCACSGTTVYSPRIIRHELGHAMGFWHTDNPADVMIASSSACDIPISARELLHAEIAYARPVGNVDPDSDPASTVNLAPLTVR